ncbi:hydroxymethylbilane synthase [Desulfolutivibrio sulfoxidireducens]|uniref:hydroxymethylbilane synthase n=1 Tax=Desulfolutivibrio sulfoxidireducens TaxID=2773299 RepID=UPI00159D67FE|nr:hydroxymethylbilane synthase [Desulfolutivibrio sulfoxidireducens]QLA17467.1 hydroxymethylbilane synthase [Desulfolutivibrio sulfoxidireducens]
MKNRIVIATRGSQLALWQANHVADRLRTAHPGLTTELVVIKTKGDKILDVPLAKVGGKGLFVKEIEEALVDGRADLAVHSMKDVPAEQPEGLVLGVVPEREELSDALLTRGETSLAALAPGSRLGTSSLRRKSQLLMRRRDLSIVDLRGNLDTRVGKLLRGDFAAIVVAGAGLNRLGLSAPARIPLTPPDFLPAAGQGALGIEYRANDADTAAKVAFLDHPDTRDAVAAERGFLVGLDGGCQVPISAWAVITGDTVTLTGMVSDVAGDRVVRETATGPRTEARAIGLALAETILAKGGKAILDELYAENP